MANLELLHQFKTDRIGVSKHKRQGLDSKTWVALKQYQNYKCAICKQPESLKNRQLCVDHCHTTGVVRGLLCSKCNQGLGMFKDSISYLQNAVIYLQEIEKLKIIAGITDFINKPVVND